MKSINYGEMEEFLRTAITDTTKENNIGKTRNTNDTKERKVVKELREKSVYHINTD